MVDLFLPHNTAVAYLARGRPKNEPVRRQHIKTIISHLDNPDHFAGPVHRRLEHFNDPEFVSDIIDLFKENHLLALHEKREIAWHITPPMIDDALDYQFANYPNLTRRAQKEQWHQMIETIGEIVTLGLAYHDDFKGQHMMLLHNGQSATGRTLVIQPVVQPKL